MPFDQIFIKFVKNFIMMFKFEGNTHSIDANTLVSILVHYQSIATIANRIYSGGAREIRINVNALEKGSFVVDLSVVQNIIEQIFSKDAIGYASGVITITTTAYAFYKHFKGRPIKSDEDIATAKELIETKIDIEDVTIINIYNQPLVREAISKSVEKANEDQAVEGFTVINEDKEINFPRSEFKDYIYNDFDNEEDIPEERVIDEETVLTIIGLNFESGGKWQFLYQGFRISITVKDSVLMQQIDQGERFGKGDMIRVKLRRVQKFDNILKGYENKSFKILEFIEHIIPQRSMNLFNSPQS